MGDMGESVDEKGVERRKSLFVLLSSAWIVCNLIILAPFLSSYFIF